MRSSLESLVPGLAELRAREHLNRAIGLVGMTRTLLGFEVCALTPQRRLALQLVRNAFATLGLEPLVGDVSEFLWVASPLWRPSPGPLRRALGLLVQRRIARRVRRLALAAAVREINIFLVEQLQDLPGLTRDGVDHSPWVHWASAEASWWMSTHGLSFEEYLRTPYPILQQLRRGWEINNPTARVRSDGELVVDEPSFLNASDRLVGQWHAERRAAAGAIIRAQRTRLN